jgi:dehydrogenase/reductase SDR family member 4
MLAAYIRDSEGNDMTASPFSLAGKVAVITGSSRGIGRAAAEYLAMLGASVVISSRKPDACAAVAEEFAALGYDAFACPAHAAREADIAQLVAATMARFGRIDILVANAGINPSFDALTDLSEDSFARIMDMNVNGPLRLARHGLPHVAAQGGAMVMVSSVNAVAGMKGSNAYGLSKAALEAMVRQLAVDWGGRGVRVNAVSPGTVRTDMIRALVERPGFVEDIVSCTPVGRIAEAADVGSVIAFLASDAARHMTGQVLTVDGGCSILRGPA